MSNSVLKKGIFRRIFVIYIIIMTAAVGFTELYIAGAVRASYIRELTNKIKTCEKSFTDREGNRQSIIMIATGKSGAKTKFYVNYYYLPKTNYDNSWKEGTVTRGWVGGWVCLIQRYKTPLDIYSDQEEPPDEKVIFNKAGSKLITYYNPFLSLGINYFKGWYVIDNYQRVCGIVSESRVIGAYTELTIDSDFSTKGEDITNPGITRFAVTQRAREQLVDLTDISFNIEQENVVRITGKKDGKPIRPFW